MVFRSLFTIPQYNNNEHSWAIVQCFKSNNLCWIYGQVWRVLSSSILHEKYNVKRKIIVISERVGLLPKVDPCGDSTILGIVNGLLKKKAIVQEHNGLKHDFQIHHIIMLKFDG